jgi:hypothetical protein
MICGTVHSFASNARVRVSRFICYRVAAGNTLTTPRRRHGDRTY